MSAPTRIVDRQVGRNAQQFAAALAELETPAERYPYLRILVSVIENAHPEWGPSPSKPQLIAELADVMSGGALDREEVAEVVRARDIERGTRQAA